MQAQNDFRSENFSVATLAHIDDGATASGRKIGYARVSTSDQELGLQLDALTRDGVRPEHIYQEKKSANSKRRPEFEKMMRELREGDTIVAYKPDRLFRSLAGWVRFIEELNKRQAYVRILSQLAFDSSTATGRLIVAVVMAVAEFEAGLTKERTVAGLRAAKARGRVGGAKPTYSDEQIREAKALYDAGATWADAALTVRAQRGKHKGRPITPTRLRARVAELEKRDGRRTS